MNKKINAAIFLALASSTSFASALLPEVVIRNRPGFVANDANDNVTTATSTAHSDEEVYAIENTEAEDTDQ